MTVPVPEVPIAQVPVVQLLNVSRVFEGTPPVVALHEANLIINQGDYIAIVGPSGSGKSTLLHLLGLLDEPSSGEYRLDGIDTRELGERQRAGLRSSRIGFVFQAFHLLPHRTTVENVMLAEVYRPGSAPGRRARAEAALRQVGLGHRLDTYPTTLSGGERQRVAVARALTGSPSLLLADEPTGNLDSVTSEAILQLFDQLHADGLTLAVITHDVDVATRAQRRLRIHDGRLSELTAAHAPSAQGGS